jgi:hypothetical protein
MPFYVALICVYINVEPIRWDVRVGSTSNADRCRRGLSLVL